MRVPQLNEFPTLPPGTCYWCGASNNSGRKWYMDTGVDLDFGGTIYCCDSCFGNMVNATHGEFVSKETVDAVVDGFNDTSDEASRVISEAELIFEACKEFGVDLQFIVDKYKASLKESENGTGTAGTLIISGISETPTETERDTAGDGEDATLSPLVLFDGFSVPGIK
jgi:hypothetical protein